MKLKILLLAVFVAGIGASYALADNGKQHGAKDGCQNVHLRGTIAPQTLTVTADGTGKHGAYPAGTQVSLAVGGTGQTVRVNVEACSTGTGTAATLSVRSLELQVVNPKSTSTDSTTTGSATGEHHGGGDHGDHHKGQTTTGTTTTAATTTTQATTTTAGTTTTTP
ncbi:MAG TPA: hypothetical protein VMU58_05080 [Gaiellaceae bacterium]|nr:hypothetical protein [Gaiellaceae bacterium]